MRALNLKICLFRGKKNIFKIDVDPILLDLVLSIKQHLSKLEDDSFRQNQLKKNELLGRNSKPPPGLDRKKQT